MEQLVLFVRFVNTDRDDFSVHAHFLGFIPVAATTGSTLNEFSLRKLSDMNIPIAGTRGQATTIDRI